MRPYVRSYVQSCTTCGRNKPRRHKPYGTLQPLPVPLRPWESINMDFIEQLPESSSNTSILVIVERLTRQAVFIPCHGKLTSEELARVFLTHVFAKHGAPTNVSTDRGSEFVSHFFHTLGDLLGIKMHHTSGHHPEANGQAERTNQTLEQYLRIYCNYNQDNWAELLPLAEFTYNNTPNDSTGESPFYLSKGYHPAITTHPERDFANARAHDLVVDIHALQTDLREQISIAQATYSAQANRRRTPAPEFAIGDKVYVEAKHIRTTRPTRKLAERFLGPFEILAQPSRQSFTIDLPDYLRQVHPVFHVSQLEPAPPNDIPNRLIAPPEPVVIEGEDEYELAEILHSKIDRRRRCPLVFHVRWTGYEGTRNEYSDAPAHDLEHSETLVQEFYDAHPSAPGSFAQYQDLVRRYRAAMAAD